MFLFSITRAQDYENRPIVKPKFVKTFELKQGIHHVSLEMNNGKSWDVNISVPELESNEKVPLVIALHWAGTGNTYKEYSECLAFPGFSNYKAIIIAPSGDVSHWITGYNEYRVINLVKQLKKHWPIIEDKISVTGYSNGAIGAWQYAQKYPKIFTAAFAQSGSYDSAQLKIPMYVLHGKKDELFNVSSIENSLKASERLGSTISFSILEDYSHFMGCAYVSALKKQIQLAKDNGHL